MQQALHDLTVKLDEHARRVDDRFDALAMQGYDLRGDVKQAAAKAQQAADLAKDTNGRVRELEKWRSYLLGGMTVVVTITGVAAGYIALVMK